MAFTAALPAIWVIPAAYLLYKILTFGRREKHLPPGPPTIPILGNAHLIPMKGLFSKLKDWGDQYGSVCSLKVGRSTWIVLNDREAIYELLGKHGAWYNDRPIDSQILAAARGENTALMHDGPRWRAERKISGAYFSPKNLDTNLKDAQESEIGQLMLDLLDKPADFANSVKRTTASIASIALYGHRAPDFESFWGYAVYIAMDAISGSVTPGSYLPVDQFPFLNLIPDRWSGKARARKYYHVMTDIWNEAHDRVEKRRAGGDKRQSLIDNLLDGRTKCDVHLEHSAFNNFLGGVHMGASDTTATATLTTMLFLASHPEFQEKARVEIDRLCGVERIPKWSDFDELPYVNCIVKEGLRVRPIVATGVPHVAKQDRWYKGMLIPAGSAIFIPAYALNHGRDYADDPMVYNPDRFLSVADRTAPELAASSNFAERDHYSYGAGRRMCVGIHLAERTQWRIVAQMLWAFRIETDVELDTSYGAYVEGFVHGPKDFMVRVVPRSERHAEMLRKNAGEYEDFLRRWE